MRSHLYTKAQRRASRISAYLCELVGMTLVLFNALGWACWNYGVGSPIGQWIPDRSLRTLLQAICAATGTAIVVYSPLGKRAGGHLNPATTLAFWLLNKISTRDALIYILMQLLGAFLGTLLVWIAFPDLVQSIHGGTTVLSQGISPGLGFGLELGMTFILMLMVLAMVNSRWMRRTGMISSALFILLYISGAKLTGVSLNPVRSLAPAALIMFWENQWIYWIAPLLGAALAVLVYRQGVVGTGKSYCCKLYHPFDISCHHARCGYSNPTYIDDFSRHLSQ
ncbi:MAG: hypothetical protein HC851_18485 [Acaryochloris sp. RU_4_1]|nr:hypothetical protein [Acaryochloris sp. RU_4_1]